MDFFKNFIKIIFLLILGGGICFEILIAIALFSLKDEVAENSEKYVSDKSFNLVAASLGVLDQTEENKEIFSYLDDEDFEDMLIVEANFQIDNIGDDLNFYCDLSRFIIKNEEDLEYDSEFINYYTDEESDDIYSYNSLSVIPSGQSGTVTYYMLMEEEQYNNIQELRIYPDFDFEGYVYFSFQ